MRQQGQPCPRTVDPFATGARWVRPAARWLVSAYSAVSFGR